MLFARLLGMNAPMTPVLGLGILAALAIACPASAVSAGSEGKSATTNNPGAAVHAAAGPDSTLLNINNFHLWVNTRGRFPWVEAVDNFAAGQFPAGVPAIFTEGIQWSAKVDDGSPDRLRAGGNHFKPALFAGRVIYDSGGKVIGTEHTLTRHVWRVRKSFPPEVLVEDAASFFNISTDRVTLTELRAIRDQYFHDWQYWPAYEGAPFEDVDGDGSYDPAVDVPGVPGAHQTLWLVANDLPMHDTIPPDQNLFHSEPIGIEMQMTLWAYDPADESALGDALFKRVRVVYTGLPDTPDTAHIDTMYLSQWSDPDLGFRWTNDFAGCDTLLNLGFVYDADDQDHELTLLTQGKIAVGSIILSAPQSGPEVSNMTSFGVFGGPVPIEPYLPRHFFNVMEGFLSYPGYPEQTPVINPLTGQPSKFVYSGDPVSGTGWLDGSLVPAGNRIYWQNNGPFALALGDTQEIVIATLGAISAGRLESVTALKLSAWQIIQFYEKGMPPVAEAGDFDLVTFDLLTKYYLGHNYPNPFNPTTRIDYDVPVESILTLAIYNLLGQEIVTLVQKRNHPPGLFSVVWDGRSWKGQLAPSGAYLYRLEALPPYVLPGQGIVKTGKRVLLR